MNDRGNFGRIVGVWVAPSRTFAPRPGRASGRPFALQGSAFHRRKGRRVLARTFRLRYGEMRHRILLRKFDFHVRECTGRTRGFCDLYFVELGGITQSPVFVVLAASIIASS